MQVSLPEQRQDRRWAAADGAAVLLRLHEQRNGGTSVQWAAVTADAGPPGRSARDGSG